MTSPKPNEVTESTRRTIEYVRPEDLADTPGNPKLHDGDLIRNSIEVHGVIEPQVTDERTGLLISGHGRKESIIAAEKDWPEGVSPPDGIVLDDEGRWTVPVVRGWRSKDDAHAAAALVVLNRAGEKSGWAPDLLAEKLEEVLAASIDLSLTGYSSAEFEDLLAESGKLAARSSGFLDDLADRNAAAPIHGARAPQYDAVEIRFAMTPAERDEAVALLRGHQRRLSAETLSATLLALLRSPVAEPAAE